MNTNHLNTIVDFLNEIGISCQPETITSETFLPGISIRKGVIYYDEQQLLSPGDLLHEAGHISILSSEDRSNVFESENVSGSKLDDGGAEMAAIAWSWAALKHLNLPPDVVFHEEGYKGDSEALIAAFSNGGGMGISILNWLGMTEQSKPKQTASDNHFPNMHKWVLDKYPSYV